MKNNPVHALPAQLLPPPGWTWGSFINSEGHALRFGYVLPENPRGVVVGFQGLSEFCEKYFETAHDLLQRGFGFFMMDWQGQGLSRRHLSNNHKRFTCGFDRDLADAHEFITGHVLPKSGNMKLVLLAHSMGGNLGLRYILKHPDTFSAAAFSAPMFGILGTLAMPFWFSLALTGAMNRLAPENYAPGGSDWVHGDPKHDFLSSDPLRRHIQDIWYMHDPRLQLGGVTWRWLYEAEKSCALLQETLAVVDIEIPCLIATAGIDFLVDSRAAAQIAGRIPGARLLEIPKSRHEILMEQDAIREKFLAAFDDLTAGISL